MHNKEERVHLDNQQFLVNIPQSKQLLTTFWMRTQEDFFASFLIMIFSAPWASGTPKADVIALAFRKMF